MSKFKEMSDIELVREISKFESRALEELYDRYSSLLYTIIKKIAPDEPTADQILIELFVIVWRKTANLEASTQNVFSWFVSLARNKAVDSLRRSRGMSETSQLYTDGYEDYYILPSFSPEMDNLDFNTAFSLKPKIEKSLSKLTDTQKYVLHLAYYEGFTIDEIADKLNVPLETVRNKIMTALFSLRDHLVGEV